MNAQRIGYVGLDHHHTEPYLQTLQTLPATVTCACEPNSELASSIKSLGDVPIYDNFETLLMSESIDAVFLTLPNRDTPEAIEQALDAGVNVYTEKPAARTAVELEPLLARARDAEEIVCVSYPWQSHPIAEELATLIAEGFFGDFRAFDARFIASQLAYRDTSHFIFDEGASRGGILQWLGIHWLQLLDRLLDERIERVNASMITSAETATVEDGVTLQIETTSGTLGTLRCGYYLGEGLYDTKLDLYGSDGQSHWDPIGRTFGFDGETRLELNDTSGEWNSTPHRTITYDYDPKPGYGGAWGREFIKAFFDACNGDCNPPATLEDALSVLRILDAAYESAETEQWVDVEHDSH